MLMSDPGQGVAGFNHGINTRVDAGAAATSGWGCGRDGTATGRAATVATSALAGMEGMAAAVLCSLTQPSIRRMTSKATKATTPSMTFLRKRSRRCCCCSANGELQDT